MITVCFPSLLWRSEWAKMCNRHLSIARRIADLEREVKQREQNREHSSLKERLEENKRIVAERERENTHRPSHDRGMSR